MCVILINIIKLFLYRVVNRCGSPFGVVHTDIWGPTRVKSVSDISYFVTFIDDYSRVTWLFLMKDRSKILSIFQSFHKEISAQFNCSLKILRSDNALNMCNILFKIIVFSWYNSSNFVCSYTSIEQCCWKKKNCYLRDTARTLMVHIHFPKYFWADAVLTICHLINRFFFFSFRWKNLILSSFS